MLERKYLIPEILFSLFLAFWMLFGGGLFWRGWVPFAFLASLAGLVAWTGLALKRGWRPILFGPALLSSAALLLSASANPEIFWQAGGWLLTPLFGLAALAPGAALGEDRLLTGLYRAGWLWLPLFLLPRVWGWYDNRNLISFWPALMILVILARGKPWWWALPHAIVLVLLGSRGAILGTSLGLLAFYRPRLNLRQTAFLGLVGLAFLAALTAYRPRQAFNRFVYWEQATWALVEHSLWFGLGPGGIYARQVVAEPGVQPGVPEIFHAHAHNLFIHSLAELGVVGTVMLAAAGGWALKAGIRWKWQLPVLVMILGHCLVDLPLYYPGPLLVFALITGSVTRRNG